MIKALVLKSNFKVSHLTCSQVKSEDIHEIKHNFTKIPLSIRTCFPLILRAVLLGRSVMFVHLLPSPLLYRSIPRGLVSILEYSLIEIYSDSDHCNLLFSCLSWRLSPPPSLLCPFSPFPSLSSLS